jgi:hypothetical protein
MTTKSQKFTNDINVLNERNVKRRQIEVHRGERKMIKVR